ncbi:hypothetical protein BsWGS_15128 [Bradybaena similaris]
MADLNAAPKLRKNRKLGKNKKKSWRASNVEDVEEFLEDERRQLRTGGLVADKSDENLFLIDTGAKHAGQGLERKNRQRQRDKLKQLRCYALLQPDPNSKAVRTPDPENFQKGLRTKTILDRLKERSQSQVRVAAQKQRQKYEETRTVMQSRKRHLPVVVCDLWKDDKDGLESSVNKPPKMYRRKPSALQATVIPHPGTSVNPSYDDHQDLLYQALVKEEDKLKKEKKLHNSLEAKFPSKKDAPNESTYLVEMSAGLVDDSSDDDEDVNDDDITISVNPPVRREDRKTKRQRRVQREEDETTKKRAKEAEIKKRENMVLRLPTLKSEIHKTEKKIKERAATKQKLKELEPFKTKRLGQTKFEEPDLELKLSTELVASLREVKAEGHLFNDIYKSLQRRNIIEPRVRQRLKKKYKPKTFEKKGHKAVKL